MTDYCGRPTRAGHPCRIALKAGRCATHDADLKKRNRKVRRAFARNDPAAYAAHQRQAGRRGFDVTSASNRPYALERARQWRLEHPTEPERWALGVLAARGLNHFEREHVAGDWTLDLAWPAHKLAVEVDGRPNDDFLADRQHRLERQARKLDELAAAGWNVLTVDAGGDREIEAARLVEFAEKAQH